MTNPTDGGLIRVDPATVAQMIATLDEAGKALFNAAKTLKLSPDAGKSSDETGDALTALSTAVAGLGNQIGARADATRTAAGGYVKTDEAIAQGARTHG